jgi:thiol-disulfide isomerase/thioredoxin
MHRSFLIFAAAFVALMAGALFYAARAPVQQAAVAPPATGGPPQVAEFPQFSLPDLAGNTREFGEFEGRHRLLNFWATWCAPCRREIPLLKEFQAEQGADGVQIIGIAVDFPEEVARYAESAEFNYPILIGQEDAMSVAESSAISTILQRYSPGWMPVRSVSTRPKAPSPCSIKASYRHLRKACGCRNAAVSVRACFISRRSPALHPSKPATSALIVSGKTCKNLTEKR